MTAVAGFLYSVSFVFLGGGLLAALFLHVGGIVAIPALVAVFLRLRETDEGAALLAFVFGIVGAIGSAIHGGYDLANAVNPPAVAGGDLPSQIDPRGLLTFGVAGLALLLVSAIAHRGRAFPTGLAYLGYLSAALLIVIFLGRLIVLQATSPVILGPAALEGFIVNPAWYLWLGASLLTRRGEAVLSSGSSLLA